jgi:hypothetical protein
LKGNGIGSSGHQSSDGSLRTGCAAGGVVLGDKITVTLDVEALKMV